MKTQICMNCEEVVEKWTLTEVFDEINRRHLIVCSKCLKMDRFR